MNILCNKISVSEIISFSLFVCLTFIIPFNSFGSTLNQNIGIMLVVIAIVSNVTINAMQLVFFLPYVAATAFPIYGINIHIITLLEIILFIKVFSIHSLEKKHVHIILGLIIYSLISILLCQAPIGGLIKYIFNILIFFAYIYILTKVRKTSNKNLIYLAYALGVLSSCIAGKYYVRPLTDEVFDNTYSSWMRYSGLWTDPNFLGFFCLTGILALFNLDTNKIEKVIILIMCVVIFYYGTLTMSRTYMVVGTILLGVYSFRSYKRTISSYIIGILILIVGVWALSNYYDYMQNNRVVANESVTNGRVDDTLNLLEVQSNDICAIFGSGCDNYQYLYSLLQKQHKPRGAAHNSYIDIILQFGYVGSFIILLIVLYNQRRIKDMLKECLQVYGLPMLCILLYLGTLSALKYEFVFFIAGMFYSEYKKKTGSRRLMYKQ